MVTKRYCDLCGAVDDGWLHRQPESRPADTVSGLLEQCGIRDGKLGPYVCEWVVDPPLYRTILRCLDHTEDVCPDCRDCVIQSLQRLNGAAADIFSPLLTRRKRGK